MTLKLVADGFDISGIANSVDFNSIPKYLWGAWPVWMGWDTYSLSMGVLHQFASQFWVCGSPRDGEPNRSVDCVSFPSRLWSDAGAAFSSQFFEAVFAELVHVDFRACEHADLV